MLRTVSLTEISPLEKDQVAQVNTAAIKVPQSTSVPQTQQNVTDAQSQGNEMIVDEPLDPDSQTNRPREIIESMDVKELATRLQAIHDSFGDWAFSCEEKNLEDIVKQMNQMYAPVTSQIEQMASDLRLREDKISALTRRVDNVNRQKAGMKDQLEHLKNETNQLSRLEYS